MRGTPNAKLKKMGITVTTFFFLEKKAENTVE
jgi:hypothetical protein